MNLVWSFWFHARNDEFPSYLKIKLSHVKALHNFLSSTSTNSKSCSTQKCSSEGFDWFPTFGPAVDHKQSLLLCENQFLEWVYEIFHDLLDCNFLITFSPIRFMNYWVLWQYIAAGKLLSQQTVAAHSVVFTPVFWLIQNFTIITNSK